VHAVKRIAFVVVVLAVAAAVVVGGDHITRGADPYVLRVSFDSGSGLRTGMDMRVSGLRVGRLRDVELDQRVPSIPRAVAVIDVTDPSVANFRSDASCAIRSASLLGDRVIECKPTQPRKPGAPAAPPLRAITVDGERQHVLGVANTSSPVDPDLVLDIFRLPVGQRLSIVINELGTGLAGNGAALRAAIRRADPALFQLDRTLTILSQQRRALARLATSSDRVLAPLSREREKLAGFVTSGNDVFQALATRRAALRRTFRRLPAFLAELRPTLTELDGLASQAGPPLRDLGAAAGRLSAATASLEPIGREGTPALRELGAAAEGQRRGLVSARPVLNELGRITPASRPVWEDLRDMFESLERTGGIERLAATPLAVGLTANGFDKYGYYLRANALITTCTSYSLKQVSVCNGVFPPPAPEPAPAAAAAHPTTRGADTDFSFLDFLLGDG
jgi:phospholipid/cholesterol/gamma-HCH transport system substrate-binding protein